MCVKILSSICLSRPRLVKEKRGGRATKKYKERLTEYGRIDKQ